MTDDKSQKRQELIEETKESFNQKKENQRELKQAIADEHAGEKIETTVNLAGDITADVETRMEGRIMDELAAVESQIEAFESGDASFQGAAEVADRVSQVLADMTVDSELNKQFFYDVYQEMNLVALGELLTTVIEAIESEQERKAGAVDGFRQE